jgi:hypothetical protein
VPWEGLTLHSPLTASGISRKRERGFVYAPACGEGICDRWAPGVWVFFPSREVSFRTPLAEGSLLTYNMRDWEWEPHMGKIAHELERTAARFISFRGAGGSGRTGAPADVLLTGGGSGS